MTLEDKIKQAFANTTYPGDENITDCSCDDCSEIATYFRGRTSQGHSTDDLWLHAEAIGFFFTPEAYCYFLPAFLLATLNDYENSGAIPDMILNSLTPKRYQPPPSLAGERIERLTRSQRDVLKEFLHHLVEIQDCTDEEIAIPLAALDCH